MTALPHQPTALGHGGAPARPPGNLLVRSDWVVLVGSLVLVALAGLAHYTGLGGAVTGFVLSAAAVALLASAVGRSVEQLGDRFGPGATGVLQSALGNLPELFISLFALKAGLVAVVRAALIGSILSNLLLVLGLCFVVGGLRHGTQTLDSKRAHFITVMLLVSVAAMVMPTLAHVMHTPVAEHEQAMSIIASVVLLALFVLTLPASIKNAGQDVGGAVGAAEPTRWALPFALVVLVLSSAAAAFVSDWFVAALTPAMDSLGISQAFAGLVVVAIAGNAIENVVGIQLAAKNRSDYAFAVVINSPLQIAICLAPLLVILSAVFGFAPLTLVFSPLLVVSVAIAVLLSSFITFDGKSNWIEGAGLIALYVVIATTFWWG